MPMSNDVKSPGFGREILDISWAPNGTSAISAASITGEGVASITRTGVGTVDIVLIKAYQAIKNVVPSFGLNTHVAMTMAWKYTAATKTLSLTFFTESAAVGGDAGTQFAAADTAAHASNILGVVIVAKASSVGK